MIIIELEKDIKTWSITVNDFPVGIQQAFDELASHKSTWDNTNFFGIVYKTNEGRFFYKAAVEQLTEMKNVSTLEEFIIRKGRYGCERITAWQTKLDQINSVFVKLVADSRLDPTSPCIEWYKNEQEMFCMVRLKKTPSQIIRINPQL